MSTELATGSPAAVLLREAREAESVVLGGSTGLLLGSISRQVPHHARLPGAHRAVSLNYQRFGSQVTPSSGPVALLCGTTACDGQDMTTMDIWRREKHSTATRPVRAVPRAGVAYRLSGALAATSAAGAIVTFFVPEVLTGPAAMNGSARGTALVVLVLAVPLLVWSMRAASRGSTRAVIAWLGAVAYLLYNALMFVFATPFNRLFLVYVAMLSLAIWTAIALLHNIDAGRIARWSVPVHAIAVYVWVVVALNLGVWLAAIVPALFAQHPAALLEGTGLTTHPVYVQDLAFWLPLMTIAGVWLWQRSPRGYVIAGSVLTMWVIESVGVAVDQWFGHAADPASPVASAAMVWVFATLAAIGCVPLYFFYRKVGKP